MAEEFDFHPMWESLGMNLADHDMLLGAVGQMYGDMFLTQNNRPKSTSYLDFVATNIHSGRIKEMLDKKEAGEATKIVGSFCVYVPEEIVLACDGIPVGLCSGADWATDKVEEHLPRNTCPLIKSFAGFKLGEVCPYIESSDLVVGENTCDGKKKAYEFFATQKNMYVMDIPNVHDESTLVTWKAEVKKLAAKIEEECGVKITPERLKAAIHAVNEKRRALQRLAEARLHHIVVEASDVVLAHVCTRIDPVPGWCIEEGGGAVPERIQMRNGGQHIGKLALDLRPLRCRRPVDRRLDLTDVLRKLADQRVERCFVLGHVDGSVRLDLTAIGKDGAGPLKRLGHVFEVRPGCLGSQTPIGQRIARHRLQGRGEISACALALDGRSAFVTCLVDLINLGAVGRDPPVKTPCRLEPDPVDLRRLNHRHPKGVVVEVVILAEKEHFAILAAAV